MKTVSSETFPLKTIFDDKYEVDFYQREYVWETKNIEDLISDLTNEFLKNWRKEHTTKDVALYDPYFMGEIVLSDTGEKNKKKSIIDGQQRITTFTLLLIYLYRTYGKLPKFPEILSLIHGDYFGEEVFNLDIEERNDCMKSLLENGEYTIKENDAISVKNLLGRYNDIAECWDNRINESNIISFVYWLTEKVVFSKVWTNSDEFAYVIFETMNDRGLSLTHVEMLRSYLLAKIDSNNRETAMNSFDSIIKKLINIKLSSKSKAESEFFKVYFRTHYAEDLSQAKNSNSDFTKIGNAFHRWFRDKDDSLLGLKTSQDYSNFIDKLVYYSNTYTKIYDLIKKRDTENYLYLIVNDDYNFTLQPAAIMASIKYNDNDEVVQQKIKIVSKYLTKILSWKTWNHEKISQNAMEAPIYQLCKEIRDLDVESLNKKLLENPIDIPSLNEPPILNQQIKHRMKVLISLITEIVAAESNEPSYLLNKDDMEIEHIWSDHFDQHTDEFSEKNDFANTRNTIGDLLVLPRQFNHSYSDNKYEDKIEQYFSQNILAQSLCEKKYTNSPGFAKFIEKSKIKFEAYPHFKKQQIIDRSELYKSILIWNFEGKGIDD